MPVQPIRSIERQTHGMGSRNSRHSLRCHGCRVVRRCTGLWILNGVREARRKRILPKQVRFERFVQSRLEGCRQSPSGRPLGNCRRERREPSSWSDRWRLFAAFISPLFVALVRRRLLCSNKPCPVSQTLGSNVRLDAIAPCVLSSTLERLRWQLYPALVYSTAASPDKRRPSRPNGKHRISATRIRSTQSASYCRQPKLR